MAALSAAVNVALGLRLLVEGSCPSGAAVQAQLAPLLSQADVVLVPGPTPGPVSGGPAPDLTARVEPLDELLRVEVRDARGRLLSLRDQRRDAPCADLAAFAAVVIATATAAQPQPPPPMLSVPPVRLVLPPRPPPPRLTVEVSIDGVAALTTASVAPGLGIILQLAQPSDVWGARLSISGTATRRLPVDAGFVDYTRIATGLLARYRHRPAGSTLGLSIYAGLWGAVVAVEGVGFAQNLRSQGLDIGSGGGLRLTHFVPLRESSLNLSAELSAVGWLRPQTLRLQGDASPPQTLPAWDMLLTLGVGWQRHVP